MSYLPGSHPQKRKKALEYLKDKIIDKRGTHKFKKDPEAYLVARKQR
jgi:hypothetical protein